MRKAYFVAIAVLLAGVGPVFADEQNFNETERLIESGMGCDKLADEQLEAIGDYYMEQMHPGEAHDIMDNMMGGEGSESLKQVHINMAKRLYCNESVYIGYGVIGPEGMNGNMPFGNGMMWNRDYGWGAWNQLYGILLIGLIIFTYLGIAKLWKNTSKK
ncbi:MAG: hypothetical protein J4431_03060 [Candidatus Aenigmarchaeota archaeon]|nr:hypothetical protein [Candidatus Aenigmarchaeota archaeon]